jgi:hypothetical protein
MFKTKNDLSEEIRAKAVELVNARLADIKSPHSGEGTSSWRRIPLQVRSQNTDKIP